MTIFRNRWTPAVTLTGPSKMPRKPKIYNRVTVVCNSNWFHDTGHHVARTSGRIKPGGALPYVGGYQVPVNRTPFFTPILHPMTPFFIQFTPNEPLFPLLYQILHKKYANFCALRAHFEKFNDFVAILKGNSQILPWNCIFAHWMIPIFGSPHQKKAPFFWCPHRMTPFFWRNLTPNAPYFRSPVGTCTSLSYLSAPPRGIKKSLKSYAISSSFKPINTLRGNIVHVKDKQANDKQNNGVSGLRCAELGCKSGFFRRWDQTISQSQGQPTP